MSALINISSLNRAFKNVSVSNTTFAAQQTAYAADATAFANSFNDAALSDAALANLVLTNMGILPSSEASVQALEPALAEYFKVNGNRGVVVMQLATILSDLENATGSLAVYKSAAAAWNQEVVNAAAYSSNVSNTVDSDKPAPGGTFTLTTATTDVIVGTTGNDTITGTTANLASTDVISDATSTDTDVLTLTLTAAAAAARIEGVENIVMNIAATGPVTTAAGTYSGVKNLTINKADVIVGGSTIVGNKDVTVTGLEASKIAAVTTGAGTKAVSITQATTAGATVNADASTGNVTVVGAGTVNAAASTGTVDVQGGITTAEDAKAVVVNAAAAGQVNVGNTTATTGAVTINAAAAKIVQASVAGGATITAKGDKTTGVVLTAIDDSGATVTTSYVGTSTAKGVISLTGTGGTTTDVATVNATGEVDLTLSAMENVTLSGNGAAATYTLTGAAAKYIATGTNAVNLSGAASSFTGATVTGANNVKVTTAGAADIDLSKVTATSIELNSALASTKKVTVATGANVVLSVDQVNGTIVAGAAAKATVNLSTADDTAANGTTIEITAGALDAATNITTLNLDATVGKFTATGTTLATDATLNVLGTKKVTLGTVAVAKAINASSSTGGLEMTANGANTAKSITTGSAADKITLNQALVFTVDAGNGDNEIVVSAASATSSFATGTGADKVSLGGANSDGAFVVVTGAGDDEVTIGGVSDSIIVLGEGTADTIKVTADADVSNTTTYANFAYTGVEKLDVASTKTLTLAAAQFAGDNAFAVSGTGTLAIVGKTGVANTIDASGVTHPAGGQTATISLTGADKVDTIVGTAGNDSITATAGADVIDGGAGTDSYAAVTASQGVVVNLSGDAVTNTAILSKTGLFSADSVTSVAAGKTAQLFAASGSTNLADQQTLTSIENVTGTAGKDYIVGSIGNNVITGGAGVDYVVGGLGADKFVIVTADADTTGAVATDVIADFTASQGDTISTGVAGSVTTYVEAVAAVADLATLLTAAGTALDGTAKIYVGQVTGGSTYVVTDTDGTGYTDVIELVGVTLATIAQADFVA